MSDIPPNNLPHDYADYDTVTLKDVILKTIELWHELLRNWLLIGLITLLCGGFFVYRAWKIKTTYTAGVSFLLTQNDADQFSRLSPNAAYQAMLIENNKIVEIARSGRIIYQVMLSRTIINNKYDFIANHIIDIHGFHTNWNSETLNEDFEHLRLDNFFFSRDSIPLFVPKEKRALNYVHEAIAGNPLRGQQGLMSIGYNPQTQIFRLNVETLNENLSLVLADSILYELQDFHETQFIGRSKEKYEDISGEIDSISLILSDSERKLAILKDQKGFTSEVSALNSKKLERKIKELDQEYDELLKRQKEVELFLKQDIPQFDVIDRTFFPIKNQSSKRIALIFGGFLGGLLASIFVIIRKSIRDAMAA